MGIRKSRSLKRNVSHLLLDFFFCCFYHESFHNINISSDFESCNVKFNSLFDVVDNTSTAIGKRFLKAALIRPLINIDENTKYKIEVKFSKDSLSYMRDNAVTV